MTKRATLAMLLAVTVAVAAPATRVWSGSLEGAFALDARDGGDHWRLKLHRSWNQGGSHGDWSYSNVVSRSDLRGLPATGMPPGGPIVLALARDAGTVRLEGRIDHGRGEGHFAFEPDASFMAELKSSGYADVKDEELVRLCVENLDRAWIREGRSLGLRNPRLSDLLRLRDTGVRPEFVHTLVSAGYTDLDADDATRLWSNGVTSDYVLGLGAHGNQPWPLEQVLRFRNNGLDAGYVSALGPYFEAEDIVRLHNNGVDTAYIRDIRALGYESASANDLVRLRNNDVSPAFARRARELHGPISTEDLIKLRVNGAQ